MPKFIIQMGLALLLAGLAHGQDNLTQPFQRHRMQEQQTGLPQLNSDDCVDCAHNQDGDLPNDEVTPARNQGSSSRSMNRTYGADNPHNGRGYGTHDGQEDQDVLALGRVRAAVPEPPTEFQRYVRASTGRLLPIFGSSLFEHVPSTFAPDDGVPTRSDYTIGPGDELEMHVWGQVNFSQRLVVDATGSVFLPQVGRLSVAGSKFEQLREMLRSGLNRIYKNFDLSVTMGQLRSIHILVLGEARHPGAYTVSSFSTLVNALFASGGPSSRGSLRRIQLRRGDKTVIHFDLYDLLLRGDKTKDVPLLGGDVIFIPTAGPRVAIAGSVISPGIYELQQDTTLADSLCYAGGLSQTAAGQRALVERIDQRSAIESQDIDLTDSGLATHLRDGDIVRILSLVPRFEKTVSLRGNVADPIRMPWHSGMKVSDLIPNKQSLLTRGYWREHNKLFDQQPADEMTSRGQVDNSSISQDVPNDPLRTERSQTFREKPRNTSTDSSLAASTSIADTTPQREFSSQSDIQPMAPDIDWHYAAIERLNPQDLRTRLIAFDLGRAVTDHDAASDLTLEPGDVVTVFSNADLSIPKAEQTKYVRIEGEIKMAGVYSVAPGETLRGLVARAGGLTSNAYLFGSQFTRESTRREQQRRYSDFLNQLESDINQNAATLSGRIVSATQAGTAESSIANERTLVTRLRQTTASGRIVLDLQPDSSGVDVIPNLPLENGDRFFIPSIPSTVNVVGMVYNQASFIYDPGLRLGDYLGDAGGPSRYADRARVFVIRADGSVVSKETRSRLFASSFDSLPMYPGDTLVMPTNVSKTTLLRSLIDWSQVISNFGIGAAAVNVLK